MSSISNSFGTGSYILTCGSCIGTPARRTTRQHAYDGSNTGWIGDLDIPRYHISPSTNSILGPRNTHHAGMHSCRHRSSGLLQVSSLALSRLSMNASAAPADVREIRCNVLGDNPGGSVYVGIEQAVAQYKFAMQGTSIIFSLPWPLSTAKQNSFFHSIGRWISLLGPILPIDRCVSG